MCCEESAYTGFLGNIYNKLIRPDMNFYIKIHTSKCKL